MINHHIEEGKKELNFSEWAKADADEKIRLLGKISDEVKKDKMPLKSYLLMHPGAKLSEVQKDSVLAWCEKTGEKLMEMADEEEAAQDSTLVNTIN